MAGPGRPGQAAAKKWVHRPTSQEVCPFVQRFSVVAEEPDYAAREACEAVPHK